MVKISGRTRDLNVHMRVFYIVVICLCSLNLFDPINGLTLPSWKGPCFKNKKLICYQDIVEITQENTGITRKNTAMTEKELNNC